MSGRGSPIFGGSKYTRVSIYVKSACGAERHVRLAYQQRVLARGVRQDQNKRVCNLKSLRRELKNVGRFDTCEVGGPTVEGEPPEKSWEEEYYDEVSGTLLDRKAVQAARELEVEFMPKVKVHEPATVEEMHADGTRTTGTWTSCAGSTARDRRRYVRTGPAGLQGRSRSASTLEHAPPWCQKTTKQLVGTRCEKTSGLDGYTLLQARPKRRTKGEESCRPKTPEDQEEEEEDVDVWIREQRISLRRSWPWWIW